MEKKDELSEHIIKTESPELPVDYFNSLTENVMNKIKQEPKISVIPFYKKPTIWLASAAALILLLFGLNYFLSGINELTFNSLSKSEVLAYVEENIDDFDEELFIEVMDETGVESDTTKKVKSSNTINTTEPISFETLSTEEIIQYLNENELSVEELEETIEQ